jgi:DNA-binding protein HU-beta
VNRAQLLRTVSDKTGMAKKEVEQVYDTLVRTVQDSVKKGEKVALTGFGNFTQRVRKGRKAGTARNPFTGEMIKVAARPAKYVSGALKTLPGGAKPAAKKAAKKAPAKKGAKKTAKKAAKRR